MIKKLRRLCAATAIALLTGAAQAAETPIIEFHTTIYENTETENAFHFVIGATEDIIIDIDCGYGSYEGYVSQAVFNPETGTIDGTVIDGSVSKEGIVRIYGDASKIDYLDLNGVYIDRLDISSLVNLQILDISYNEIKALDLTPQHKLQALYADSNPFTDSPLILGKEKPDLALLSLNLIDHLDPAFNFSDYPSLVSATSWSSPSLTEADVTGCPYLRQLSIDISNVSTLDVTKNPDLRILNIAGTKITDIDLSNNPLLSEFYCGHTSAINSEYKMRTVDLSHNPALVRLGVQGNDMTDLDVSGLPILMSLMAQDNKLTSVNIDNNPELVTLDIMNNDIAIGDIPEPRETFIEYYYRQNPYPTASSHPEGAVIDFGPKVLREGSVTLASLFSVNRENPGVATELDDSYYSWDANTGKLTVNKACADSVYVSFTNTALPDAAFRSKYFMIKDASEYGKPTATASLVFSAIARTPSVGVGISGATEEHPVAFHVDFGDGELHTFQATTETIPATPNVSGSRKGNGTLTIYVDDDTYVSAISVKDQTINSVDFSQTTGLAYLSITGCRLNDIDLSWNSLLAYINLSDNALTGLSLKGANGSQYKNMLTTVIAPRNKIETFDWEIGSFTALDLSDNNFAEFSLLKMSSLVSVNLSGNHIESISLQDSEALEEADFSNNSLTSLTLLDYVPLKRLDVSNNNFTFDGLPLPGQVETYTYAPQKEILIPEKAPVVSLYPYLEAADKTRTVYTWHMADTGSPVTDGSIRENEGRFFFDNPDLGTIYCTLTNQAFPDFAGAEAMRTGNVTTADMPEHMFATFTALNDGGCTLSFAGATNGTTVYVDWTGEGDFEQLVLKETYQVFEGTLTGGKQTKFYSYDEEEGMRVFSVSSGALTQADGSAMKNLTMFALYGSQIGNGNLILPESPALKELSLTEASLATADFIRNYPELTSLNLSQNEFEHLDVSSLQDLNFLSAAGGRLKSVTLRNPSLYFVDFMNNEIESIDLSEAPAIEQLLLSGNSLGEIDVDVLPNLLALYIDGNRFTFATLPEVKESYLLYSYSNQAQIPIDVIDGKVDLSSQATVGGVETEYRWFIDSPYYDDNGDITGEELYVDDEYTIENGVTTFLSNFNNVICLMTNSRFPNLNLLSTFVDVRLSGVEGVADDSGIIITAEGSTVSVKAPAATPVGIFTTGGTEAGSSKGSCDFTLTPGIYIVKAGNRTAKIAIR
ncbi:MAG: hypothetical protein K2L59_00360 [Muribaculaceae bacterium]|nr:hypothetical protein [Muribaculaceae bacterium]